jgi:hypothetical protein
MHSPSLSASLRSGVVVSQTESRLRRVRSGGSLRLVDGQTLTVAAVVPDAEIGGYEVALDRSRGVALHITQTGYLLVRAAASLTTLSAVVHRILGTRAVRIRRAGVRPFLRAGDDVLPQSLVKERFGEFAIRRSATGFRVDPAWVAAHIQTRQLPVLGAVTCNRAILSDLAAVTAVLVSRKLTGLVDVADFHREGGCFNPRPLRGGAGELSRHAWGAAIDVNVAANQLGGPAHQDARLVRAFADHGLTWGGRWLRPDPQHFEWVGNVAAYTEQPN